MKIDGLPVIDSKKPAVIMVTAKDVKAGKIKNPQGCAVARACVRQLGADEAIVHATRTYVRKGKQWLRFFTPDSVRSETIAFDRGGKFAPGAYELQPIPPSLRKGAYAERYAPTAKQASKVKRQKTKHRAKRHVMADVRNHEGWGDRVEYR